MIDSSISPMQTVGAATLAQPSTAHPLVELPTRQSTHTASGGAGSSTVSIRSIQLWKFSPKDFEDFVTLWSKYTTYYLVKSSPFYTKTTIIVNPRAKSQFPEKSDIIARAVHAVHPIPRNQLQDLVPACLYNLGVKLEEVRWDVDRTPEFNARV